jgi:glycosyltransferase involved in cell wall biosynthesis
MTGETTSVIMAAYNAAAYIGEAISSVLEHTPSTVRLIIVNDGSTDSTAARARMFGARVTVIEQENQGIYSAQNRGIIESQSEWLTFLDADDLWTPDYLPKLMGAFRADPTLNIAFGHCLNFYSPDTDSSFRARVTCPPMPLAGMGTSTMLIRRTDFLRVGLFQAQWKMGTFMEWIARANALRLKQQVLEDVILLRRLHPNNTGLRPDTHQQYARVLVELIRRKRAALQTV